MKDPKKSIKGLENAQVDTNTVKGGQKIISDPHHVVSNHESGKEGGEGWLTNEGNETVRRQNDKFGKPE